MKKISILLFAWIITAFIAVLHSCNDGSDCGKDGPYYQHLDSINVELKHIIGTEKRGESNYLYFVFEPVDTNFTKLKYDSFAIEVSPTFISLVKPLPGIFDFNKAFACSPYVNYSKLTAIEVISNEDYDISHPKGANLADIIKLIHNRRVDSELRLSQITKYFPYVDNQKNHFVFTDAPQKDSKHNFTITYKLENGKDIITHLDNVSIRK